jgi:hypothetical protein
MKVRSGFVSNSSSSSFIIAIKGNVESAQKEMENLFALPESYPLKGLVKEIPRLIWDCIDKVVTTIDEYKDHLVDEGSDIEDIDVKILELITKGFHIHFGSLSSEEGVIESILCDPDLSFESDNLYIQHEGR